MDLNAFREQLKQQAGICPSQHWLEDACAALRNLGETETTMPDALLHQILHHDLRSVVRTFSSGHDNVDPSAILRQQSLPSVQLRQAIADSHKAEMGCKADLPASFRLMVQVEELLDVSQNAAARLHHGPTNQHDPTAVGNQRHRCLKLFCADGYDPITGFPLYVPDENQNTTQLQGIHPSSLFLIAMEIVPVPQLSANSLAGCKVVLQGPLQIRHGVMMWNPGNTIVLGGDVDYLVEIQKKAWEQAKRVAGFGVDPTVRALIGTNPHGDDEGNQDNADEAEHESSDVVAPPAPAASFRPSPPPPPPPARPPLTSTRNAAVETSNPPNYVRSFPQVTPPIQTVVPPVPTAPLHPYSRLPPTNASSWEEVSGPVQTKSASIPVPPVPANPYASTTVSASMTRSPASRQPIQHPQPTTSHYSQSTAASSASSHVTLIDHGNQRSSGNNNDTDKPKLCLSYDELYNLMTRLRTNPSLYRQYEGHIFVSSMRQVGGRVDFNIVKRKEYVKGTKDNKYEYHLVAKFWGSTTFVSTPPPDLLTCKIASSLQEPHFGLSPGDMRALNKKDRQRSELVVSEGGKKITAAFACWTAYELTLLESADEFFATKNENNAIDQQQEGGASPPALNGDRPVLLIVRRAEDAHS